MTNLFCFGMGYSALELSRRLQPRGWPIAGTSISASGVRRLAEHGFEGYVFESRPESAGAASAGGCETQPIDGALAARLDAATHVLLSIPPDAGGDPVLRAFGGALARARNLQWIGYLSTIGVYGDQQGNWVDETTATAPGSDRSRRRVHAEDAWLEFGAHNTKHVQIFRLAGIYGPGRSAIDNVRDGSARRIIKPGQVFNRTHVADIASVLEAAMAVSCGHSIFNVTDDEPAPPQDVIAFAAELMGLPVPPGINYDDATFSPMGRSFYSENKRVRNERIKASLGVVLQFPNYREGLKALAKAGC